MIDAHLINADSRSLRRFGFQFAALGVIGAILMLVFENDSWIWFVIGSLLFMLGGMFAQPLLRPVYIGWMRFALLLGWINTRIILSVAFYFMITPIGLALRLFGKDLLRLKIDRPATTYWIKRPDSPPDPSRVERQF